MDIIGEFKDFVELYYAELGKPNNKMALYSKFGINRANSLNGEEIGILLGVARSRVSILIIGDKTDIKTLIHGEERSTRKRPKISCNPLLCEETKALHKELIQLKILNQSQLDQLLVERYQTSFNINHPWTKLYFSLFDIELIKDNTMVILDKNILPERVGKVRNEIIAFLQQRVIPCTMDDIIIDVGKMHGSLKKNSGEYVQWVLPALEEVETLYENNESVYQLKLNYLSTMADYAYRVLVAAKETLYFREIFARINFQLVHLGRLPLNNERGLVNQMCSDQRFSAVGGGGIWSLAVDNINKASVKELMITEFIKADRPLLLDELFNQLQKIREIKRASISGFLADERFLKIKGNQYIIKEWERKYSDEIIREKRKQVFDRDSLIIEVFKKSGSLSMTLDEIWGYIKEACPRKGTLHIWLADSNILTVEKIGIKNYWKLTTDYESRIKEKSPSKTEKIKNELIVIIKASNNSVLLKEVIRQLQKQGFNDRLIYRVITDHPGQFVKEKVGSDLKIKLLNWEEHSPLANQDDFTKQMAELHNKMGNVQEQLGSVQLLLEPLFQEFHTLKESIINNPDNSDEMNLYAQKIKDRINGMIQSEKFPQINILESSEHLESIWQNISKDTREYLTVGEHFLKIIGSVGVDLAPVCICYCRAVELELNCRLLLVLKVQLPNVIIKRINMDIAVGDTQYMMIGEFYYILNHYRWQLDKVFLAKGINLQDFSNGLWKIKEIRNKVAHQGNITLDVAEQLRALIIGDNAKTSFLTAIQKLS